VSTVAAVTTGTARGERTKRLLIDAARERFARDGYRSTTVAVISRDAGLGSTTAFVHFENKEALFFAAVDDDLASMFREFTEQLGVLMALDAEFLSQEMVFQGMLGTVLEIIDRHPLARRLLAGLEPDVTGRVLESPSFDDLRATLVPLLDEGQRAGWIRPDLPTTDLADGLTGFVLAMAMASVQIGPAVDRTFGRGITTVLRGLLAEDPRRS
jgi:AcrR family transcriptional regulator